MKRWFPERALPSYAHVPGRTPDPHRDPRGHSFREIEHQCAPPDPGRWRECEAWLVGVDLWNEGFPWEAHESWETAWRAATDDDVREFLRALIQAAAGLVHLRADRRASFVRLTLRAADHLEHLCARGPARFMGLDAARFAALLRAHAAQADAHFDMRPTIELEVD